MSTYTLRSASPAKTRADAVVVGVVQAGGSGRRARRGAGRAPAMAAAQLAEGGADVAAAYGRKLRPLLAALGVTGKAGEVVRVPTSGAISSPLLVLVGLGRAGDDGTVPAAAVRRAAGVAARTVTNAASVALALPADSPDLVRAVTEGFRLGGYTFTAYKHRSSPGAPDGAGDGAGDGSPAEVVVLSAHARDDDTVAAFAQAQVVAEAVAGARDWVNTPAADLTPPVFADAVVEAAAQASKGRGARSVTATVLDDVQLRELGCGGLLGVGAGSVAPPRLVELSYRPRGAGVHLALVGKGITYDSGGLSIKTAQGMTAMKSDMAGAAAVVQATLAIARLKLPVRVSTFVPMAENMISGSATRPGDVVTIYGGTTVEVLNTDAEGRLVLADALGRAVEQSPDVIVDVATLTGAMVVALGDRVAGVMGSADVVDAVLAASEAAGEDSWPMPIPEEMDTRIHSSTIADVAQVDWVRWGGGLYAAAFLREFTGGRPWAHLDIAGPSFNTGGAHGHLTPGGTGWAVATLVDYARGLAAG